MWARFSTRCGGGPGAADYVAPNVGRPVRFAVGGALELVQVVVVVPRHETDEVPHRQPPGAGMRPGALPLLGFERRQELERLLAPAPEARERLARVVPQVLAVKGPGVGVDGEKFGLVVGQDRLKAVEPQLLDVAEMADDLLGRPGLLRWTLGRDRLRHPLERGGEVISCSAQPLDLFGYRCHVGPPCRESTGGRGSAPPR